MNCELDIRKAISLYSLQYEIVLNGYYKLKYIDK